MRPKAQHYIPQFYLRNFAVKRKRGYLICCFDKATRKTFNPNIKNVANQTGFYDFVASTGEEVSIEELFSDLETEASNAIQALIETPTNTTLSENRNALANFIAVLEFRTPVFRDEHDEMVRAINEVFGSNGPVFLGPTEDGTKEFQAQFLIEQSSRFARGLLELKWILLTNPTGKPFWTSDNPIFRHNPHKQELMGNLGMYSSGIQIIMPISPWLSIVICDPLEYAHLDAQLEVEPANVNFNNSGQVIHSRQYLFSVENDFHLAQQMIDKDSEIANPNRSRIIVNGGNKVAKKRTLE